MTKQEAIDKLNVIKKSLSEGGDAEQGHAEADDILCDFLTTIGHDEVSQVWKAISPKWYA